MGRLEIFKETFKVFYQFYEEVELFVSPPIYNFNLAAILVFLFLAICYQSQAQIIFGDFFEQL